jgi:2-methylcitrate dehydratase PrpD
MDNSNLIQYIEGLSSYIVETPSSAIDTPTIELAKNRIINILGSAIGGANAPGNKEIIDIVREQGGKKESTIMIFGGKIPAENAAMVNAIMARSYDLDVMAYVLEGKFFPSHHAATTIPTALALAEAMGASGKDLLTAIIIADDLTARIQAASTGHPIVMGWDGGSTLPHLAATAVASRLLGLDKKQTKNAFGIAVNLIGGTIQNYWDGAQTFKLGQGTGAMHGIFAARLAKKGWIGLSDPLFCRYGYFSVYGGSCTDPGILTRELGKKFYAEGYYKSHPCGMPTQAGITAALALVNQNNIQAEDIREVTIHVPYGQKAGFYYAKPFSIRDYPQGDAAFSYIYTIATALVNKNLFIPHFSNEAIHDPRTKSMIEKVKMVEFPEGHELGVQVDLLLTDGRQLSEYRSEPREFAVKPTPREEIIAKFHQQVAYSKTVSRKKADNIIELIQNIENLKNVNQILKFMTA